MVRIKTQYAALTIEETLSSNLSWNESTIKINTRCSEKESAIVGMISGKRIITRISQNKQLCWESDNNAIYSLKDTNNSY